MTMTEVTDEVAWHMGEILKLFKPGRKITILVRLPDPEADFCMTSDEMDDVLAMVARRKAALSTRSLEVG